MDIVTRNKFTAVSKRIEDVAKLARLAVTRPVPRTVTWPLTDIEVGTENVTVSWLVPITGDYVVAVTPVVAAARAGTLRAVVVIGTKTPTSVDIAVSNTAASTMLVGALDVIVYPQ